MLRLISARSTLLAAIYLLFFMDHRLFMPFGMFLAFGLFMVFSYLYRDFIVPKPINGKQVVWSMVLAAMFAAIIPQILLSTGISAHIHSAYIHLGTNQRLYLFAIIVIFIAAYTIKDAKEQVSKLKARAG